MATHIRDHIGKLSTECGLKGAGLRPVRRCVVIRFYVTTTLSPFLSHENWSASFDGPRDGARLSPRSADRLRQIDHLPGCTDNNRENKLGKSRQARAFVVGADASHGGSAAPQ